MADICDIAQAPIEATTQSGVNAIRSQLAGAGQPYCEDCGLDLSPERRAAAPWAIRCVPCGDIHERMLGGFRRG